MAILAALRALFYFILSLIRAGRVQAKHSAEIIYIKMKERFSMKYEILNKLDKILTQHGFYTKYTSENAFNVALAEDELPYCELIQYDAKHIDMVLGSDFDDVANSAQDYDDIDSYENSEIETKQKANQLMFILNLVNPYLA